VGVPPGMYLWQMRAKDEVFSGKMVKQ